MCSSRSDRALPALLTLVGLTLGGCAIDAGEYEFGFNITGIEFVFFDETEGVFPSQVTLANPNNPFRGVNRPAFLDADATRFDVLTSGGNAGAFYYWATLLARIPIGEHQFFTAAKLHDIATSNELDDPVDRCRVRLLAGDAYQAVLDEFPDAVSFLEDGTPFYLAPLAYRGIRNLGLDVQGDWVLAVGPNGEEVVTRVAGSDLPRIEIPPPEGMEDFDPCMPQ